MLEWLLVSVGAGTGAYFIGSIPFGVLVARAFNLGDLRAIGSGNIGTTNVLRTGSKAAALITLVLDAGKGAVAVGLAYWVSGGGEVVVMAGVGAVSTAGVVTVVAMAVAGVMVVIGHCFPIWLGFRGGKGVATGFGVLLAIMPWVGVICVGIWLVVASVSRLSSLAALGAYAACPFLIYGFASPDEAPPLTLAATAIAVICWWQHRGNIGRILRGVEGKIGL